MSIFTSLMKNMLKYELKKVFHHRYHLLFLLGLLIIANLLFAFQCNQGDLHARSYQEMQQEIKAKSHEERVAYFKEQQDQIILFYEQEALQEHQILDYSSYIETYGKEWVDHVIHMDHDDLPDDIVLKRCMAEEANLLGYEQFLENVDMQFESNQTISIFQKQDSFVAMRGEKTKALYQDMQVTMPSDSTGSYGTQLVLQSMLPDIMILIALLYLFYELIVSEDEKGLLKYCSIMKKDTGKQLLAKWMALMIMIMVVEACMSITLFVNAGVQFGIQDLHAPIQSVLYYVSVPYHMNVWMFIVVTYFCKMIVYLLLTSVLMLSYTLIRNYLLSVFAFGLLVAGGILLSSLVPKSHLLSYLDIFDLLQPAYAMKEIFYIRMGTQALSYWYLYPCCVLLTMLVMVLNRRLFVFTHTSHRKSHRRIRDHKVHSFWYYEGNKLWIRDGGLLLLALLFGIQLMMVHDVKSMSDTVDIKYNYYVDMFGDTASEKTDELIQKEHLRYEEIRQQMAVTTDIKELNMLIKESSMEDGFRQYENRYETMKQEPMQQQLIKEDQVRFLIDNDTFYSKVLFVFLLFLILISMLSYDREHTTSVLVFQKMADQIKRKVSISKWLIASVGVVIAVCCLEGLLLYHNDKMYPDADLGYRLCDSVAYLGSSITLSIGWIMILQLLWQIVLSVMIVFLLQTLFHHIAHTKLIMVMLVLGAMTLLMKGTAFSSLAFLYDLYIPWKAPFKALLLSGMVLILTGWQCHRIWRDEK